MSARMLDALKEVTRCLEWHVSKHGSFAMDNFAVKFAREVIQAHDTNTYPRVHGPSPEVFSVLQRAADAIHAQDGKSVEDEKLIDDYDALMRRLMTPPPNREAMTDAWLNKEFTAAITVTGHNVEVSLRSFAVRVLMAHGDQEGVRQGLVQVGKQRIAAQATESYLLAALKEIVKNDPYRQSSAGDIARAAVAKAAQS